MLHLGAFYPWVKAFHVIAVIAWMAGLLYLPRLFAYHAGVALDSEAAQIFETMERKLEQIILNPSLVLVYLFGGLLFQSGVVDPTSGWLNAKLGLVVLLTIFHATLMRWRRRFLEGVVPHSPRYFKIINEVPSILMIVIVILVIVRPF